MAVFDIMTLYTKNEFIESTNDDKDGISGDFGAIFSSK